MPTTINPFEPPRTTELDAAPPVSGGATALPAALAELAATARWVRRLARLTALGLALKAVDVTLDLAQPNTLGKRVAMVIGAGFGLALATLFLTILRRYAAASERLRGGDLRAAGEIVDAQASYFKLAGILTGIFAGLIVILLGLAMVAGYLLAGGRR